MNIYVEDNSKNMQDESFQKNYRNDVYVKIDNKFYNVSIITINRLKDEVKETFKNDIIHKEIIIGKNNAELIIS